MASHPWTLKKHQEHLQNPDMYAAKLTDAGVKKVTEGAKTRGAKPKMVAGVDYKIQEEGGEGWMPLGQGSLVKHHRHDWVMELRHRPYVPVIYGAQGSQSDQEQAMRLLVLFFPWVNCVEDATSEVPFIGDFWQKGMQDWRQALRTQVTRLGGFPTEEVKRYMLDFSFVYFLPRGLALEDGLAPNSDNEVEDDELELELDEDDLAYATLTHVKGGGSKASDEMEGPDAEDKESTMQYNLAMDMFRISKSVWLPADGFRNPDPTATKISTDMQACGQVQDHGLAEQAAKASRSKTNQLPNTTAGQGLIGTASVQARAPITKAQLQAFVDNARQHLNPKQLEFLELVVDRVMVEEGLISKEESVRNSEEPLIWLLHGPPGTGKSHVLGFVRELFDMINYAYGLDYEVVAYQGSNAADLGGKTIHKALGFDRAASLQNPCSRETAKRIAHWRWLIMDEISLTDANLLAKAEHRICAETPSMDAWKHDSNGHVRPFGGINVILTGDFHQLPPVGGPYLADIPRQLIDPASNSKAAEQVFAERGRELMWAKVQGVTELTDRERCKDDWWNEVTEQKRHGRLSEENHKYLHGIPVEGCTLSPEERASRCRVITSFADPRLQEDKFKEAPVIVSNNDARCQINKDRTMWFSRASRSPLRWARALDRPASEVLQEEICDKKRRIRCMNRRGCWRIRKNKARFDYETLCIEGRFWGGLCTQPAFYDPRI